MSLTASLMASRAVWISLITFTALYALLAVDQRGLLGLVLLDVVDGLPRVDVFDASDSGHETAAEQHKKYCQQDPQQRPTRQALHIHHLEDRTAYTCLLIPVSQACAQGVTATSCPLCTQALSGDARRHSYTDAESFATQSRFRYFSA